MTHTVMTPEFRPHDPARRIKGIAIVVAVHVVVGYVLISGMARHGLQLIKKPLEAVVIQEVIIPPPPPPPPPPPKVIQKPEPQAPKVEAPPPFVPPPDVPTTVSNAPAIVSTATPPPTPAPIAPPPPPAPAPAPAPAPPKPRDIGVICPTQVPPEMPRKALQEGIGGTVRAQARILNGEVKEVTILSGPRIFHNAVKDAMLQYKCVSEAQEVVAVQEFNFKVD